MESSGFFTSKVVDGAYDRSYTAEQFAKYFSTFIGNGVFAGGSALFVSTASSGMKVNVSAGNAWINGYWYENSETVQLSLNTADGTKDRIDAIVLRWSSVERLIHLVVKSGTAATSPVNPTIDRNADIYELCLAYIKVPKGSTVVQQSNITDMRLDATACGIVGALVEQWDLSQYSAQMNAWFEEYKRTSQSEFTAWFNSMKDQLTEDAAGNLQIEIDDLQQNKADSLHVQAYTSADCGTSYGSDDPFMGVTPAAVKKAITQVFLPKSHQHSSADIIGMPKVERLWERPSEWGTGALNVNAVMTKDRDPNRDYFFCVIGRWYTTGDQISTNWAPLNSMAQLMMVDTDLPANKIEMFTRDVGVYWYDKNTINIMINTGYCAKVWGDTEGAVTPHFETLQSDSGLIVQQVLLCSVPTITRVK